MAYVTRKPGNRFEIRESVATPRGPRSRTLATFRELDDAVLAHARERARRDLEADVIRARARALGAPVKEGREVDRVARALIAQLGRGERPAPVLIGILRHLLGNSTESLGEEVPDTLPWIGASLSERGRAARDLARLTDRLPTPKVQPPLAFPGIRRRS